jgi:hypothetical protein
MHRFTTKNCVSTQAEEKKKKAMASPNGHIFRIQKDPSGTYEEGAVFFVFAPLPRSGVPKSHAIYLEKEDALLGSWDNFDLMIDAGVVLELVTEDVEFRFIYDGAV